MIEVERLGIRYITGDFKDIGLKEYFVRKLTSTYVSNEFWAVDDVTFSVGKGELLGIIGTNGAGKSTMLKAISGIMVPSRGAIRTSGKIVALLELTSGFDGDMTVKENAYLRAAMLGYTREFMDEQYPRILEFSGLQAFEDRPFRQLSSGMKARMAFSVASMVQPEILILDEVLSVGDGAFRKKSERKMREIIRSGATTVLVSHSLEQIRTMCTKVLWIENGRQMAYGDTRLICAEYNRFLSAKERK